MKKGYKIFGVVILMTLLLTTVIFAKITKVEKEDSKVDKYIEKNKGDLTDLEYSQEILETAVNEAIEEELKMTMFRYARNILNKNPDNVQKVLDFMEGYIVEDTEVAMEIIP